MATVDSESPLRNQHWRPHHNHAGLEDSKKKREIATATGRYVASRLDDLKAKIQFLVWNHLHK
jgi:hypothetical protein